MGNKFNEAFPNANLDEIKEYVKNVFRSDIRTYVLMAMDDSATANHIYSELTEDVNKKFNLVPEGESLWLLRFYLNQSVYEPLIKREIVNCVALNVRVNESRKYAQLINGIREYCEEKLNEVSGSTYPIDIGEGHCAGVILEMIQAYKGETK